MEFTYSDIAFMSYISKAPNGDVLTIYLRFNDKVGVIEHTDVDGELLEPRTEKLLKTSSFKTFLEQLEELDILNWPRNNDELTKADRRSNVLVYSFKTPDDYVDYNTKGKGPADLAKVHQLIEDVLGETFGSQV